MAALLAFSRAVDWIGAQFGRLADWLVLAACAISAGNAFVRYVFFAPTNAWLEMQWYLFAGMVMFGAAYTLRRNEHVRVDILYGWVAPRTRLWIDFFGMVLFLLPRALAMQAILRRNEQQAGVFLAESLAAQPGVRGKQGAEILWHIRDAGRFWTLALLFWWAYLELTLPALLRPAGMAPAPLRLYNFLHYGHIPGLAAMLAVVLLVPVLLLTVGKGIWMRMDGLSTEER